MKRKPKTAAAIIGTALLAGTGGVFAGISISDADVPQSQSDTQTTFSSGQLGKVEQVYQLINKNYVEDIDGQKLIDGAVNGMVEELDDPHSTYMDKETSEQFVQSLDSSFEGIGAEVRMVNDKVTVVSPIRDTPAEKAGLLPNDQILEVNGENTKGDSLHETVMKIRGEKGTFVTLTVQRQDAKEPFEVEVERAEIPRESVYSKMYEENGENIGHLEITSFAESTADELESHLNKLEEQGMDGLIIDVRGNPGGYLASVEDIGDLFIPNQETVVQIENPEGDKTRSVSALNKKKPYPIVGLIDQGSVSASEILAAALKESGGYDLVGKKTYGKGTVQQPLDIGDGSELKLSMYKWLTPDGNWINEKGVTPTVEVEQPEYFYSPVLSPESTLSQEDVDEQVKIAQGMLEALGYQPGRTDGYFDEGTVNAVKSFQQDANLESTGNIDKETAGRMNQDLLELIRNPKQDRQLEKALELASSQVN